MCSRSVKPSQRAQSLKKGEFNCYLNTNVMLGYYKEIYLPNSKEERKDEFGVEQEPRAAKELGLSQKADFMIRYVQNGDPKKVILCENKRRSGETQDAVWEHALEQAVRYATLVRTEPKQNPDETLYITVNVGTHLRFYELPGRSTQAEDFKPAKGRCYELADDEEEVWALWHEIRDVIMH